MDLGLKGKTALVCAASRGLGKACAFALAEEGVAVTITSRDRDVLERTAEEIRSATGSPVQTVVGDITTLAGREAALAACAAPDILILNAGGPPLGRFESFDDDDWQKALESSMLSPIALVRALHPGMRQRGFGRIIAITSAMVKAPTELLPLSSGPRAGLTAALSWLAREGTVDNVTINTLLPEMIMTDRARSGFASMAEHAGKSADEFVADFVSALPARRMGRPEEFSSLCAFLCSAQAGYVTNQHIVVDGGHFGGVY